MFMGGTQCILAIDIRCLVVIACQVVSILTRWIECGSVEMG